MSGKVAVVLAGGLIREANGTWRTATYEDVGDNFGLDGHRIRVEAASILYKDEPGLMLVASGGKGQNEKIPDAPTTAAIIMKELIELGVPATAILLEDKSGTTYQQLIALIRLIEDRGWQDIQVVSNSWHLPRIKAMITNVAEFSLLKTFFEKKALRLVDADQLLTDKEPWRWKSSLEKARGSEAYASRLATEKKGILQIEAGTYKFK